MMYSKSVFCVAVIFLLFSCSYFRVASMAEIVRRREVYNPENLNDMTRDARMWYNIGMENGMRNLAEFKLISDGIGKGHVSSNLLIPQLQALLKYVTEANDNNKILIPRLSGLIQNLYDWTRNPSLVDKVKLKTVIHFINGRRDNKSYYLQNGAGYWLQLRLDNYLKKITGSTDLKMEWITNFENLEESILLARDTLDDVAQDFLKNFNELVVLVGDIGKNHARMREVAETMKLDMEKKGAEILASSEAPIFQIRSIMPKT